MTRTNGIRVSVLAAAAFAIVACGGGEIEVAPNTTDSQSNPAVATAAVRDGSSLFAELQRLNQLRPGPDVSFNFAEAQRMRGLQVGFSDGSSEAAETARMITFKPQPE